MDTQKAKKKEKKDKKEAKKNQEDEKKADKKKKKDTIRLGPDGKLQAGTIEAIVSYLLEHSVPPPVVPGDTEDEERRRRIEIEQNQALQVFIISYRQFVSPTRFFLILEDKFKSDLDSNSRCAVLKMLMVWLDKYLDRDFFFHDKGNRLFDQLLKFIAYMGAEEVGFQNKANELKLLILRVKCRRRLKGRPYGVSFMGMSQQATPQPENKGEVEEPEPKKEQPPLTPVDQSIPSQPAMKKFSLCEMPLVELAEQLTLIERNMFRAIKEREFLNLNWKRPENKRNSRHIVKMVERFNKVSYWVATRIVRELDQKRRTSLLKRFIILAEKCAELNNYNTLMEVLAGLNLHPVQRLKETWKGLSDKYRESMENLESLMENKQNYKNYRERLERVQQTGESALPYLGVYLRDLTFVEEGNNTITEDNLINYEKIELVGQVIREVQYFQYHSQYPGLVLSEVTSTVKYLKKLRGLRQEQLDEKSRQCESMKNPQ